MVMFMKIGASSSCLYPMNTEEALRTVGELGAKTAEIFFNSPSELENPILSELKAIKDFYGMEIRSVHPFTSAYETYLLFSDYKRRTLDGIEFYKRYFDAANALGAEMIVLHGGRSEARIEPDRYAENYILLHNAAREQGLYIAHENVHNHLCGSPGFMKALADNVGEDFKMVLDIKQCRRCGVSEDEYIRRLGNKIYQVHISDGLGAEKCLVPGAGEYDFAALFKKLRNAGYDKSALIELYRHNFGEISEISEGKLYLENMQ